MCAGYVWLRVSALLHACLCESMRACVHACLCVCVSVSAYVRFNRSATTGWNSKQVKIRFTYLCGTTLQTSLERLPHSRSFTMPFHTVCTVGMYVKKFKIPRSTKLNIRYEYSPATMILNWAWLLETKKQQQHI